MPLPVCDEDVHDITIIDHAFVGGKERLYEHLGISRTVQIRDMTEEQLEIDRQLRDLEVDFDNLQMDIIRAHPEGHDYEEPRKRSSVEVSRGYMRFLKNAPKGLIAMPIPPKTKGADDIAKAASHMLEEIASGLYDISLSTKFRHQNFSNFTLTTKEMDWLTDHSTSDKVLEIHYAAVALAGAWTPLIIGPPLDKEAFDERMREINEACAKTESVCEKLLVPSRERGIAVGQEVIVYENNSKLLAGRLKVSTLSCNIDFDVCQVTQGRQKVPCKHPKKGN